MSDADAAFHELLAGQGQLEIKPGCAVFIGGMARWNVVESYEAVCEMRDQLDEDSWMDLEAVQHIGSQSQYQTLTQISFRRSQLVGVVNITDIEWEDYKLDHRKAMHDATMGVGGMPLIVPGLGGLGG